MWDPQHLTRLQASTACYRDISTVLLFERIASVNFLTFQPTKCQFRDKDPSLKAEYVILGCVIRAILRLKGP
jgi:hypothetical protein